MKFKRVVITDLSRKELVLQAYISQILMLFLIAGFIYLFPNQLESVFHIQIVDIWQAFVWGSTLAFLILIGEWMIQKKLGSETLEDDGLNHMLFSQMGYVHMVWFCLIVSVIEEILFRAILQSLLGLFGASLIFALVHVRYLKKPILLTVITVVSFLLGLLFLFTENILAPIAAHFVINLVSGIYIRVTSTKRVNENE